jgi:hypothetical protein
MFKFIRKWLDDYHAVNDFMASQGLHVVHTPYACLFYVDDRVVQRLNNTDDRHDTIPIADGPVKD